MIEWIFLASVIGGTSCLRLTRLDVPHSVIVGQEVRLHCGYELEGDVLYSVKWYKDDLEFYRFVPSDRPPDQIFLLPGIRVDRRRSNNGTVYLSNVSLSNAGIYRCEISADAPSFQTVAAEKMMLVDDGRDCRATNEVTRKRKGTGRDSDTHGFGYFDTFTRKKRSVLKKN